MREPFSGASCILNVLFIIEVLLGGAVLAVTTFYLFRINTFLSDREHKILLGQLLHFHVLGLVIILINVANLRLWKRLWETSTLSPSTITFLNLWLCFNTVIFLCGLGTIWCLSQCAAETITTAETALIMGIDEYYESPEWKLRWDELQINEECCGVVSYHDWQTAIWLPIEKDFSRSLKTRAPYSCCQKDDLGCYKTHMPDVEGSLPLLPLNVINRSGCISNCKRYLELLINLLWKIVLAALFFQFCICFLVCYIICNQSSEHDQDFNGNVSSEHV